MSVKLMKKNHCLMNIELKQALGVKETPGPQ